MGHDTLIVDGVLQESIYLKNDLKKFTIKNNLVFKHKKMTYSIRLISVEIMTLIQFLFGK